LQRAMSKQMFESYAMTVSEIFPKLSTVTLKRIIKF